MLRPLQPLRLMFSPFRLQSQFYWRIFRRAGLRQARVEAPAASIRLWRSRADAPKGTPLLMLQGFCDTSRAATRL